MLSWTSFVPWKVKENVTMVTISKWTFSNQWQCLSFWSGTLDMVSASLRCEWCALIGCTVAISIISSLYYGCTREWTSPHTCRRYKLTITASPTPPTWQCLPAWRVGFAEPLCSYESSHWQPCHQTIQCTPAKKHLDPLPRTRSLEISGTLYHTPV